MDNTKVWLDKVQQTCQHIALDYIDIIIDQCGMELSVIPAFSGFSPEIKWQSLYQGLPEDIYLEDAPLLVRIDLKDAQQVQWLYELAQAASMSAPLLVLGTFWPFSRLADWLGQIADATLEGRSGIFRFWDTRIFPYLFTHILDESQQNQLRRPVLFWSWQDRDGHPVLLEGNGALPGNQESCVPMSFNDRQFENLMCLCDAKQFLVYQPVPEDQFSSKEEVFAFCFNAMLSATKQGLILESQRDIWVNKELTKQKIQEG